MCTFNDAKCSEQHTLVCQRPDRPHAGAAPSPPHCDPSELPSTGGQCHPGGDVHEEGGRSDEAHKMEEVKREKGCELKGGETLRLSVL